MITLCWTIECILSYFLLTKSYRNRFALNDELMLRNTGTVLQKQLRLTCIGKTSTVIVRCFIDNHVAAW